MKEDIKKYQRLIEIQIQKSEYEKFKGLSGERRHFHKFDDMEELAELMED